MLKAILFDLDDTLLKNSMATFAPALSHSFTCYMAHLIPTEHMIPALESATAAMDANEGAGPTSSLGNRELGVGDGRGSGGGRGLRGGV